MSAPGAATPQTQLATAGARSGTGDEQARPPVLRWAVIAFVALAIASFVALFIAQRIKLARPLIVDHPNSSVITPNGDGIGDFTTINFRVVHRDLVTVVIVDSSGKVVRTLMRNRPYPDLGLVLVNWGGLNNAGVLVPQGTYRPRVTLVHHHRTGTIATTIKVAYVPPHK